MYFVIGRRPCQIGVLPVEFNLFGKFLGQPFVVGVEKCNPLATGCLYAGVTGDTRAAVLLVYVTYLFAIRLDDTTGVIR